MIYQDGLSEATQLQFTLSYFEPAGTLSEDEEEEDESGLLPELSPAVPVVAAESPEDRRSPRDRRSTYRFTEDSSLLSSCRIVQDFRDNKPIIFYRSSCGQYFRSKDKLISFMKSKYPERAEEDNDKAVMSENAISASREPVGVSCGEVSKVVEEEPESRSQLEVSDLPSKTPQGSMNPVKSETIYVLCNVCDEEMPKNILNKHILTHAINRDSTNIKKAKIVEKMKNSVKDEVSKSAEVQKEDDNNASPKQKGKEKVTVTEEEEAQDVSSDFLNMTCPLPMASSPSEKDKNDKREKTSVKMKRSRSISTIEKPHGPKKSKKPNVEESPGPSLATTGSERKEPVKRGRKKKTN